MSAAGSTVILKDKIGALRSARDGVLYRGVRIVRFATGFRVVHLMTHMENYFYDANAATRYVRRVSAPKK